MVLVCNYYKMFTHFANAPAPHPHLQEEKYNYSRRTTWSRARDPSSSHSLK